MSLQVLTVALLVADIALFAVAIAIGFLTFWGRGQIIESAQKKAEAAAVEKIERLVEERDIRGIIRGIVEEKAREAGDMLYNDFELTKRHSQTDEDTI